MNKSQEEDKNTLVDQQVQTTEENSSSSTTSKETTWPILAGVAVSIVGLFSGLFTATINNSSNPGVMLIEANVDLLFGLFLLTISSIYFIFS